MTPARIILHGDNSTAGMMPGLCVDDVADAVLLTATDARDDVQVRICLADARRLGEWLIKRANEVGGE